MTGRDVAYLIIAAVLILALAAILLWRQRQVRRWRPPPSAVPPRTHVGADVPTDLPTRPRHAATAFTPTDHLVGQRWLRADGAGPRHARVEPADEPGQTVR